MIIQLKVIGPGGEEKIIDLCHNEEQLKKITVRQLREKLTKELGIGMCDESFTSLMQHVCFFLMN